MSTFNFNDYQNATAKPNVATKSQKVGFFKISDDGGEAIVRFNIATTSDLPFATVHTIQANGRWMKVSCKNAFGASGTCPLCEATANGMTSISKASSKVYLEMLEYIPQPNGTYVANPVVWERPAGFAREIANALKDYGNLKAILFKIRRNGKAGDMKTTYSLNFAPPTVYKDELFPADFSAFDNFNIAKHSYWEKSEDEIAYFLTNGAFPEVARTEAPSTVSSVASSYAQPAYSAPAQSTYSAPVTPTPAPSATTIETDRPARSWNF